MPKKDMLLVVKTKISITKFTGPFYSTVYV